MLSFRSILLAAAAFATFTSAIPAPAPVIPVVGDILTGGGVTNGLAGGADRRGDYSAGDIFKKCHDDVAVIVVKIQTACKVEGGAKYVDKNAVVVLLKEIVAVVGVALGDLKLVKKGPLYLGGKPCSAGDIGGIVGALLILIIEVLILVGSVLGFVDALIWDVVKLLGPLLCELLTLVIGLVDGLLIIIVGLLSPYKEHCKTAGLSAILIVLGIKL